MEQQLNHEIIVEDTQERIVAWIQQRATEEFPFPSSVSGLNTQGGGIFGTFNGVQIARPRPIYPYTTSGWVFNLFMTVITLGSWLPIWFIYGLFVAGDPIEWVHLLVHPDVSGPASEAGGKVKVTITANDADWLGVVREWVEERYARGTPAPSA
jgi:hypothetical protein